MVNKLFKAIINWLPLGILITLLTGLIYVVGQQNLRQNANDPQIQITEDIAMTLSSGTNIENYNSSVKIDISLSLAPFFIIYNQNGAPIAGTGLLSGALPTPPPGVFSAAKKFSQGCRGFGPIEPGDWKGCNSGENRITWQPRPDTRIAAVIKYFSSSDAEGYVLVGRSLREVEKRKNQLTFFVLLAWVATMFLTFVAVLTKHIISASV